MTVKQYQRRYIAEHVTDSELPEWFVSREDYEALQAALGHAREQLQSMIDQTTPLEPVPGDPRWSRRIQLDEVTAERDQLRAQVEGLLK